MSTPSELVRPWRGVRPDQRVRERRERLLAAALEVFTRDGFGAAKVRDVCAEAGLTQRYFYESFTDKEALLSALAEDIVADFVRAAGPSLARIGDDFEGAVGDAVRAAISSLTDDPRRAQLLTVEIVGVSAEFEERRRLVIGSLVDVLRGAAAGAFGSWASDSAEVELIARAAVGAAQELVIAHARRELPLDRDELADNLTRLFLMSRPILEALAARPS